MDLKPMPYKEAVDFFKKRTVMSPSAFEKMAEGANNAAKARAFTIAGVARTDVLSDIHGAIEKAIAEGETFGDFRGRIDEIMENRGWAGLAPHRLDNIFRTNIQTSYMAGRHAQMKQVARRRPYWQYNAVNDSRTRPTHLAMNGKVYPHDHPFWNTWYPPNGYRCRCSVTSISKAELEEEGLKVEKEIPKDPVTGETFRPDKGWNFNPAEDVWKGMAQTEIEKAWATPATIAGTPTTKTLPPIPFDTASVKRGETYKDLRRSGLSEYEAKERLREDFRNALGMMAGETSIILKDPIGDAGIFDDTIVEYILKKQDGREAFFEYVRPTYEEAYEVWLVRTKEGQIRKQYIRYYQDEKGKRFLVSMDLQRGVWVGYNAFPAGGERYIKKIRELGDLIYRRE